ncbi:hypothetical protein DACRYDRAFT_71837, partial [Dacryopinax primogenitus]
MYAVLTGCPLSTSICDAASTLYTLSCRQGAYFVLLLVSLLLDMGNNSPEQARASPHIETSNTGDEKRTDTNTPLQDTQPWGRPAVDRNFANDLPSWIGKGDNSPVWSLYNRRAADVHGTRIEKWDANMDVLLVFSALFSAVLTAFLVASLGALFPHNSQHTVDALVVLSAQIGALNNPGVVPPEPYQIPNSFVPTTMSVCINGLWLISLTISLFTSVVAMLAKQWFGAYSADLSSVEMEQARQRQFRYTGIIVWHVHTMVNFLPILLHIAVFIFLVGFIVYPWGVNTVLTAIMATIWLSAGILYVLVSLAPIIFTSCPYKSQL